MEYVKSVSVLKNNADMAVRHSEEAGVILVAAKSGTQPIAGKTFGDYVRERYPEKKVPLITVDGQTDLAEKISANSRGIMTMLNPEQAMPKYGEQGRYGALELIRGESNKRIYITDGGTSATQTFPTSSNQQPINDNAQTVEGKEIVVTGYGILENSYATNNDAAVSTVSNQQPTSSDQSPRSEDDIPFLRVGRMLHSRAAT